MSAYKRIDIAENDEATVVHFHDKKILEATHIQELGEDLFSLLEEGRKNIVLNFTNVEFLSSAALNKLIIMDKKAKAAGGKLNLCCLRPEIHEVFVITRLNQLFDIQDNESDAIDSLR